MWTGYFFMDPTDVTLITYLLYQGQDTMKLVFTVTSCTVQVKRWRGWSCFKAGCCWLTWKWLCLRRIELRAGRCRNKWRWTWGGQLGLFCLQTPTAILCGRIISTGSLFIHPTRLGGYWLQQRGILSVKALFLCKEVSFKPFDFLGDNSPSSSRTRYSLIPPDLLTCS